jgi:hypothetical protein
MRSFIRLLSLSCILVSAACMLASDKKSATEQYSALHFTVVKDANEKPVRNASVILHPVNKNGTQAKGGYQLKTDNEGKADTDGIPYGTIRIQVLAPSFQTFGEDYTINQPNTDIQIRLKRPTDQFTSYDKPNSTQQAPPSTPDNQPH